MPGPVAVNQRGRLFGKAKIDKFAIGHQAGVAQDFERFLIASDIQMPAAIILYLAMRIF